MLINIGEFACELCDKIESLISISKRNTHGSVHFPVNFVKVKREHLIKHLQKKHRMFLVKTGNIKTEPSDCNHDEINKERK